MIRGQPNKTGNVRTNVTSASIRVTTVAVGKPLVFQILSQSAALFMQHAMRMRRIVFPSVACLAASYSPTLFLNRHDIRINVIEYETVF